MSAFEVTDKQFQFPPSNKNSKVNCDFVCAFNNNNLQTHPKPKILWVKCSAISSNFFYYFFVCQEDQREPIIYRFLNIAFLFLLNHHKRPKLFTFNCFRRVKRIFGQNKHPEKKLKIAKKYVACLKKSYGGKRFCKSIKTHKKYLIVFSTIFIFHVICFFNSREIPPLRHFVDTVLLFSSAKTLEYFRILLITTQIYLKIILFFK